MSASFTRPLLMRILPERLRARALNRLYRPVDRRWSHLFAAAELLYAPEIRVELVPTDFMHVEIAFTGCYERKLTNQVVRLAKHGGVLVDVGANIGYFSLLWAASAPANRVVAFEAAPRPGMLLKRNVARNGLADRITVHATALGAETGIMHFDLGPEAVTGWGGLSLSANENTIEVHVQRLDEALPGAAIDLLKIDVEGADTWVLFGAERLLAEKRIKRIVFEQNHPRMQRLGIDAAAAPEFLARLGYRAEPLAKADANVVNWHAAIS
jgi:FkbM family methyltransferase